MRTTLTIDNDVLAAAKELAAIEGRNVGEIISALARSALRPEATGKTGSGIPLLAITPDTPRITSDMVHTLQEELL